MGSLNLEVQRHQVKSSLLKPLIRQIWMMTGPEEVRVEHRLLPSVYPEILINLSGPIHYDEQCVVGSHYTAARTKACIIRQQGPICVMGISLFAAGAEVFLSDRTKLWRGVQEVRPQDIECEPLLQMLESLLAEDMPFSIRATLVEELLAEFLKEEALPTPAEIEILEKFQAQVLEGTIGSFCSEAGVHERKLERMLKERLGISPKTLQRVLRFQRSLGLLETSSKSYGELVDVAADSYYYDQNHFIKEFKAFSGDTPTIYVDKKPSVRQLLKHQP